jgi:L-threonylcarbamoyladenylate synthase
VSLTPAGVAELQRAVLAGELVLLPTDTVYGLACDPHHAAAVARMHALKDRGDARPAAVLFSQLQSMLGALPELGERTRAALTRLLPGALTVLVENPLQRFSLAGGEALGLRVPRLEGPLEPLAALAAPLLQTSANATGTPPARRLEDVPAAIRVGVAVALDAGELPGVASTVVDLRSYAESGRFEIVRAGAVSEADVRAALD